MILNVFFYPRESDTSDGVAEHVAQDRRIRISGWKVGVETGVLPVSHLHTKKIYLLIVVISLDNSPHNISQ
jgi:hypothetical protein